MTPVVPQPDNETLFVFDSNTAAVDTGLFGPDSVTWRVWSHPAAFVGSIRSFMTEMLSSPEGAAAVADFGTYKSDSIGRLQRTMQYFLTVVYGDTATVAQANLRLRRMHNHITGTTPVTKTAYSGVDPLLMLGTHLMTWHSVWVCYEKLVGKQSQADEDRYFAESARAAEALGMDQIDGDEYRRLAAEKGYDVSELRDFDEPPTTRQEYARFLRAAEPTWCVTPQTREVMDVLLAPSNPVDFRMSLVYRFYPILSNAAAATMPRRMRAMASIPTSKAWEVRSIALGRVAVAALAAPGLRCVFERQTSSRGYALMHEALAGSTTKQRP